MKPFLTQRCYLSTETNAIIYTRQHSTVNSCQKQLLL